MDTSILTTTKKILGIAESYTAFDLDIITHINSAFSTLAQLGVGPLDGFMIEDETKTWSDFTDDQSQMNSAKSYVFLRVRLLFDPPSTSYLINAYEKQIEELEWRMNSRREETDWVNPDPPVPLSDDIYGDPYILDGGGA